MAAAKSAATTELVPDEELEFEAKGVETEPPVSIDNGLGATPPREAML